MAPGKAKELDPDHRYVKDVRCVFYSEKLSDAISMKMAQKLAFKSTKWSPCLDFKFSIFGPRYSHFKRISRYKIDVKSLYLGTKIENLKSEQGDLLVDPKTSFCVIFIKIAPLSFSE